MKLVPKLILAAAVFIVSGFVLGIKLLNPTQIQITIEGNKTRILPIQEFFGFYDVLIIVFATAVLCITAMYILYSNSGNNKAIENEKRKVELEKQKWQHTLKTLKDDEKTIYEAIFLEGGLMYQSELVAEAGFSHAKVTRCLDALENRGLVERRRKGMGNIVLLR
ncbi:MAG: hypothetical protein A7316_10190 [Candidatus Altiarchaeales archaeon WOR_SM1_86-2]|nr:MAG: hypothetical protein A7316_10190 [Candidatus Altiarchaeales archaeon WOR_SM1_86-2]ODS40909.1 MAG: hypothetical protein A7315_07335 [Candidatus Altiarchaeales archaeon WOR_SM1_79]